jgi:hypothetical protein
MIGTRLKYVMVKPFKRILVLVGGGTVLALGVAMILLPGPAVIVIPAGLAILAIEFAWARRWLRAARAVWPRSSANAGQSQKRTAKSMRRNLEFLFRRVRSTLFPRWKSQHNNA